MSSSRVLVATLLLCCAHAALGQQRADAVLIVNSASARYGDAQRRIQPYLDHFGVPYTVLDLATTPVGPEIASHALIVIGHAEIDPTGQYLSASEQATLEAAVRNGCGLVNFDFALATSSRTARYPFVTDIFAFGYGWNTSGEGILFPSDATSNFVTSRHAAGEIVWARQMAAASVVPPATATVLARYWDSNDPFLVATGYGDGRAVQFTSYEWMSRSIRGPLRGLDDLVWRSLAWAARKPFVMQGLPNFLTMRVDDVLGGFWWVDIANELQVKPWLGLFYKSITEADAADLAALTTGAQATASVHGDAPGFFYYDHFAQAEYPDTTLSAYFQDATAWHATHGIPISSVVVPHFYEIGANAFPWLQGWGVRSVMTHMTPGDPYGAPWLMLKPFRVYEAGASDDAAPVAYADYLTIPGHPELANQFFNCATEIRDDAGYEWYPDATDVPGTVGRGTRQLKRALDSMALATLFTHEYYIQSFTASDWRAALQGILGSVSGYAPVRVTLDQACEYLRAKHDSRITSSVYDPATQVLTTDVAGRTDVDTQFMVFTESSGQILQSWAGVPAFSGSTRITQQLTPGTTPTLTAVVVRPASASLQTGETVQYSASGSYSDGSVQDVTALVTWASSNPAVATIGASGRATGVAAGTVTISATYSGITGGVSLTVTPALSSVAVTPASPSMLTGATIQLTATGTYADGSTRDLTAQATWTSSTPAVATVGTSGLVSALAAGTSTISATVSGVTGSTSLTVSEPALSTLALTPAAPAVTVGGTQQFTATGTYADGSTRNLTTLAAWTSSATGVASVSATGLATALASGTTTITASVGGVSGSTTLAVLAAPLAITTSSLPPGQRDTPYSTTLHASGGTPPYAWAISSGALPPGLVLAPSGAISGTPTATGTFAFTATVSDAASANASAGLSISVAAAASGVSIWPAGAAPASPDRGADSAIELGVKFRSDVAGQITGIRFYKSTANTGTHVGSLWSSSGTRLASATFTGETASGWQQVTFATPVPISASVTYVASYHANAGHYARDLNYFATAGFDNPPLHALASGSSGGNGVFAYGASSTFPSSTALAANYWVDVVFTLSAPTLTSIAVTPANPSVAAGLTRQFTATGTYSDGSVQDLTTQVTWTSSSAAIATVSASGLGAAVSPGTAIISAALSGVTGSTTLSVTAAILSSITVTPASPTVTAGGTRQFTATGTYSNGSTLDLTTQVTWASASPTTATISQFGLATAVAAGTSTISATLLGVTGATTLTVTAPTLSSITVTPANPSVAAGGSQQFTATGTYSNGSTQDLTTQVTWTSSSPTTATISATGLGSALAAGTTTISATLSGVTGTTTFTVTAATLSSIAVTPVNPSVAAGGSQQFTATGTYSNGSTQNLTTQVTWTSSTPTSATISATGLASALAAGTTTISATLSGVTGSTTFTVTAATLSSIAVTPANPSVAAGGSQQFTATGTYSNGSTQDLTTQVTWASSSPAAATISATGLASALTVGTTTISATLSGVTGSTTFTITAATLSSIAVTPVNPSVAAGGTQQFTATGTYSNGSTQDLTSQVAWTSSNPISATITATGLASALAAGTTTISATLSGVTGATTFTVTAATLSSIAVTPASPSVAAGGTQQFIATGTYSNGSTQDLTTQVTWTSSSPAAATISASGLASALAVGTTTISASLFGVTGTATFTVTAATLSSIAVTPANPSVAAGGSQQFAATGTYSNGTTQDLTTQVAWTSSNPNSATITATGLASALAAGTTTVSASLSGVTGTTTFTITAATLSSIAVAPVNPSIAAGGSQQFTATGTYSNGSTQDLTTQVTWASSSPAAATISATGLASALAVGTTTISATLSGVTGTTTFTITAATLSSIAVAPVNPSVAAGGSQQFTATGTYSNGSTLDLTTQVTWASSNTTSATISATGLASALAVGTTNISATLSSVTGTTTFTVTAATLSSIAVTPANPSVAAGGSQQFTATGTYSNGSTLDLTSQVAWTSSSVAVGTISATGLASALAVGTTTISASLSGVTGTTAFTVTAATLSSIAVTPASPSVAAGGTQQFIATGTYSNGTTQDLTTQVAWTSSNPNSATITATGLASALAAGTTTVSASLSGVTGTTTFTITAATLSSIAVAPVNPSIAAGGSQQFTATGTYSNGSSQDLTTQVAWTSSNPISATISATGLASALAAGTSTISATLLGMTGATTLTVTAPTLSSITVTPANTSVAAGGSQQFTAIGTYSNGSTLDLTTQVTWTSSSPTSATISATGLASALAAGTTTVSASLSGVTGTTTFTITAATLSSIAVTPTNPSVAAGGSQQFIATGTYSNGSALDLTSQVAWTSSNPISATITATGLASALAVGTATVSATLSGITGTTTLTITAATLSSIAVTPTNPSIAAGGSQQFAATGTYSNGSTQDLTSQVAWTSSNPISATISATGLASALAAGTTTVSATLSGIPGATTLTVTAATLSSIAVTPANPSVAAGGTQQFIATGTYSNGSTQDLTTQVTWTSSSPAAATISASGLASALAAGTTTVSATLSGVTGTTAFTVTAATLSSIAVTPASPSVAAGGTQQFTATGTYSNGSTQDLTTQVTWTSSSPAAATISATGLVSALAVGTTTVSATLSGITGTTTLTITAATLSSIAVAPTNPSIAAGGSQQFAATGTYSNGSTQDLTSQVAWTSSNSISATISATGLASALAVGTTTISATLSGVTGTTTFTVTAATLSSIAVAPVNPSVAAGGSQQFIATGTYSNGSTLDLTSQVAWNSSNIVVGTISATGLASALAAGTTTISATLSGVTGTATFTVTAATLSSIAVTPANPSVAAGGSQQFIATGTYSNGSALDLTSQVAWTSSNPISATISATGLASALAVGTTTISASLSGVTGATTLTVAAPTLSSISVTPANPSIAAGGAQQFIATGTYSNGSTLDLTSQVAWTSSNPISATISATGLASALAAGTATISATLSGVTGATTLTVSAPTLSSIAVTPANPSVAAGGTQQFTATGIYSNGSIQDLTSQVAWNSSNIVVGTISATGLASALTAGTTTISASLSGITGTTTFTVTAATLSSIAVTPANPSVAAGGSQQFIATGTYSNGSTLDLTPQVAWSSSNIVVGTISATGLASALAAGTTTISATLSGVTGTATFTVTTATLSSIAVTPANPSVAAGGSQQFTATGTYSNGSTQDLTTQVTWTSSSPAAATISATGLASALAGGTTTVSATLSGITGTTTLTITAATLSSIAVSPANPSVAAGGSQQFTATGIYSNATTQDLTTQVTWTSSSPSAATISATGLASALAVGTTTISATLSGVTGTTTFTVTAATLSSIAVTPVNPSVAAGGSQQFTATGTYSNGSTLDLTTQVTWASSNTTSATISATGLAAALAVGTTTVSATLSGVTGTTTFTVTAATLSSITVTPTNPAVPAGGSQQFTATGTYSNGSSQDLTTQAAWTSSTIAVGTISATGLAAALAPGATTISAAMAGVSASTTMTVTAPALAAVTLAADAVAEGDGTTGTVQLGGPAGATGSTVLLSSGSAAVTVPASVTVPAGATTATFPVTAGRVNAETLATITASAGGTTVSARLTVRAFTLTLAPTTVGGGNASIGTLALSGPVAAPITAALTTGNPAVATVPPGATIGAGATSVAFTVSTSPVTSSKTVAVTSTHAGIAHGANLSVRVIGPSAVSLDPGVVVGGTPSTGTVTLTYPAPAGGFALTLASSRPAVATVPPSITVPEGATSATFAIVTYPVTSNTSTSISASGGGVTKAATLSVRR